MFNRVLVPVDLNHLDKLSRALGVAAELAKSHRAEVLYLGIYDSVPSEAASGTEEFTAKLNAFAEEQSNSLGVNTKAVPTFSHDTEAELTSLILSAAADNDVDAIVMASHIPGWVEHVFHSNAGYVASHAKVSVFVVR